jgi:cell division protein FtsB
MREYLKDVLVLIVGIFLLGLILSAALYYKGDRLTQKIAVMETKNETLQKENQNLLKKLREVELEIQATNIRLKILYETEKELQTQYEETQTQLKNLIPKYEKANRYSRNFNADSIRKYFSNF